MTQDPGGAAAQHHLVAPSALSAQFHVLPLLPRDDPFLSSSSSSSDGSEETIYTPSPLLSRVQNRSNSLPNPIFSPPSPTSSFFNPAYSLVNPVCSPQDSLAWHAYTTFDSGSSAPASQAPSSWPTTSSPTSPTFFPPPPIASTSTLANSSLSPALIVGQSVNAVPSFSTTASLPRSGTLPARRGSSGGFGSPSLPPLVVGSPTGALPLLKPFIRKLHHLLSHPELYSDCITWDAKGEVVIILHGERLHNEVLPRMFGHGNSASLTRQLNVYVFHRLPPSSLSQLIAVHPSSLSSYSAWRHPSFTRGSGKGELGGLKPRVAKARLSREKEEEEKEEGEGGKTGGGEEAY